MGQKSDCIHSRFFVLKNRLFFSALQFISPDQAHYHTNNRDNQPAEKGRPKAGNNHVDAKELTNLACEPKKKGIDEQGEQAQS